MPSTSQLWTLHEVAQRLRMDTSTVRKHVKAGVLPVLKAGGTMRVTYRDLEQYIGRDRARMLFADAESKTAAAAV